jgi:outer membrane protein
MKKFFLIAFFALLMSSSAYSQKVGFISSDLIRDKFPEAKQVDIRVQSVVEDWKRELEVIEKQIQETDFDIKKNRLVWSDEERTTKEKDLENLKSYKLEYARKKFEVNGEYDVTLKMMMQPVEEKIFAAVQEVSQEDGFDLVWDKAVNPLIYTNFKYDLTLKVLKKLGVSVDSLEKDLQKKIDADPRNQTKDSKEPPKRSRSRTKTEVDDKNIEKEDNNIFDKKNPFDQNNPNQNDPNNPTKTDPINPTENRRKK